MSLSSGQIVTWSLAAITLIVLPRYLGAEGAGVISIGAIYATIVTTFAGLGIGTAITRDIAKDPRLVAPWLGLSLVLQIGTCLVLGLAAAGVAIAVGSSRQVVAAVSLSCCGVPFSLISLTTNAVLQGLERMAWTAIYDVANKCVTLVLVLAIVAADGGVLLVLLALNLGSAGLAVGQLFHMRRLVTVNLTNASRSQLIHTLREGLPFLAIALLWAIYTSVDIFLLSVLTTEDNAGIYAAPLRLFGTALFIPATLAVVVFPRLVASNVNSETSFHRLSRASLLVAGTAGGAITLGAILLSEDGIVALLGSDFERSGPVMLALSASLIPTALNTVGAKIAFADDRQTPIALLGVAAVVVKIGLGIGLIRLFDAREGNGAIGAAISLAVVEWLMLIAMLVLLPKVLWSAALVRRFLGLAGATALALVTLLLVATLTNPWLAGLAGTGVYGSLLVLLGAHPLHEVLRYVHLARPRQRVPSRVPSA